MIENDTKAKKLPTDRKSFDVIVIGVSFAGLSAALQIVRALRQILVIDAGEPRNRFASYSHEFLGQDGKMVEKLLK